MSLNFKPTVANPDLMDLMDAVIKDIFLSLNCHAIATVQMVDYAAGTLTATINYTQTNFVLNEASGNYAAQQIPYPLLTDVPFIVLGGGTAGVTFPIAKGDNCLLLFNDRDIDNWFTGAHSGPVSSNRLHSLSDAIALVGLKSKLTIDPDRAVLQNGTALVGVSATKVRLANGSTSLVTVLQNLVSAIEGLTAVIATGIPIVAPPTTPYEIAIAAAGATASGALAAVSTLVGELLE